MIREMMMRWECSSAMYVGDTAGDEQAARKAGLDFGYVSYGLGVSQQPDYVFDSFEEIVRQLRPVRPVQQHPVF
jgi:phosphoglycolate phosphatase